MLFRFRSDIKIYEFEDLGIVLDDSQENCYILNHTATWLLSMMSDFVSLEYLLALAKDKYKISPTDNICCEIQEIMTYFYCRNLIDIKVSRE